jgi:hypothetical protein
MRLLMIDDEDDKVKMKVTMMKMKMMKMIEIMKIDNTGI